MRFDFHKTYVVRIQKGSNIMKFSLQLVLLLMSLVLISGFNPPCYSQGVLPNGEPIISSAVCINPSGSGFAEASLNSIYFIPQNALGKPIEIYSTDDDIANIKKKTGHPDEIIVTFVSGEVIVLNLSYYPPFIFDPFDFPTSLSSIPNDALGDAIYVLSSFNVYVTRDSGKTVQIDTAGLEGYAFSIAIDSAQNVYAATSNGLYKQHP